MSEIVDAIKGVMKFAEEEGSTAAFFGNVCFDKGQVWAQGPRAGAVAPTPGLDISIAVSAHKLGKVLQAVKDPEFEAETGKRLTVRGSGKASIEGMPVKDMPKIFKPPEKGWIKVGGMARVAGLVTSVSQDTTRVHLSGIHLKGSRAEATDGHGAMLMDLQVEGELPEMIVTVQALTGIPDECWLALEGGRLFIADNPTASSYRFARCIEATFPPCQQIVDGAKSQGTLTVGREALIDVLKQAKLSAKLVRLHVTASKMSVEVDESLQTLFSFASSVPVEHGPTSVPSGVIGFDAALLIPMLQHATSEKIDLWLTPAKDGGLDPIMLRDGAYTAILMPYRLT